MVSLIVEWENAVHVDSQRTRTMLRTLGRQVRDEIQYRVTRFELIVTHDPDKADQSSIRAALSDEWSELLGAVPLEFVPVREGSYYVLKNCAALHANGEILVFVDCDVLPEPGWLHNILQPLRDPAIGVSQGSTYVQPTGLLTTGLALAWLFPLKRSDGELTEKNRIIANNVAFRRQVFLDFPYPDLPTWRGQCTAQRALLEGNGVRVHWCNDARTVHPFPDGIAGTIERAFLNGHDHVTRYQMEGGAPNDWRASYWRWRALLRRARSRRERMQDELMLSPMASFVCTLVAIGYWGCAFLSECMVHLSPGFWRRCLRELPRQGAPGALPDGRVAQQ